MTKTDRCGEHGPIAATAPGPGPDIATLRQLSIFQGLDLAQLQAIRRHMRLRVAERGTEIISTDDAGSGPVFFLLSGRADVARITPDGRTVRFSEAGRGAVLGDIAALDGALRSASVTATETCRLAVLTAPTFRELLITEPAFGLALLREMAGRIRRQNERSFRRVAMEAGSRIAAELLGRIEQGGGHTLIEPAPRQTDIADLLGLRRETVAREFGRLARAGIVTRDGARLLIDEAALRARIRSRD